MATFSHQLTLHSDDDDDGACLNKQEHSLVTSTIMKTKIASIALLLLVLFSCSKEKRLNKILYSMDGNWKIANVEFTEYENNVKIGSYKLYVLGDFHFNEDKTGNFTFVYSNNTTSTDFTWSATADELTLNTPSTVTVFKVTEFKKKLVVLEQVEEFTENNINYKQIAVWKLFKQI